MVDEIKESRIGRRSSIVNGGASTRFGGGSGRFGGGPRLDSANEPSSNKDFEDLMDRSERVLLGPKAKAKLDRYRELEAQVSGSDKHTEDYPKGGGRLGGSRGTGR